MFKLHELLRHSHLQLADSQLLRPMQTDPILLANNTQHCWAQQCCDLLRLFSWNDNNVGTCCVQFKTGQTFRPMQTDAILLANNTQQCWELLTLVASVCMGLSFLPIVNAIYLFLCPCVFCFTISHRSRVQLSRV